MYGPADRYMYRSEDGSHATRPGSCMQLPRARTCAGPTKNRPNVFLAAFGR